MRLRADGHVVEYLFSARSEDYFDRKKQTAKQRYHTANGYEGRQLDTKEPIL